MREEKEKKEERVQESLESAEGFLNRIGDSLSDMDFESLSDNIRESVNFIRQEAEKGYKDFRVQDSQEKIKFSKYYESPYERYKAASLKKQKEEKKDGSSAKKKKKAVSLFREIPGVTGGPVEMGLGISAMILFGGLTLVFGISATASVGVLAGITSALCKICLPFALAGIGLFCHGKYSKNRAGRLKQYDKACRDKSYIMIDNLIQSTGIEEKLLRKDIHFILDRSLIPGLSMDEKETCLLFTEEAKKWYEDAEQARIQRELEELQRKQEEEELERKKQEGSKEERALICFKEEMQHFFTDLHENQQAIDSDQMQEHMRGIEELLSQILACVEEHPDMMSSTGHLISYYLPCMSKLLKTYEDLEEQPIQGENIQKTKREIEESFETIRTALTNMYDEMFRAVSMDISSDIQVMKAVMAQDGLHDQISGQGVTEDDFFSVNR